MTAITSTKLSVKATYSLNLLVCNDDWVGSILQYSRSFTDWQKVIIECLTLGHPYIRVFLVFPVPHFGRVEDVWQTDAETIHKLFNPAQHFFFVRRPKAGLWVDGRFRPPSPTMKPTKRHQSNRLTSTCRNSNGRKWSSSSHMYAGLAFRAATGTLYLLLASLVVVLELWKLPMLATSRVVCRALAVVYRKTEGTSDGCRHTLHWIVHPEFWRVSLQSAGLWWWWLWLAAIPSAASAHSWCRQSLRRQRCW